MEAEKLTERLCQSLYESDPIGVAAELVRLAKANVSWPDLLCGMGSYAAGYRVTDWFSVHWILCLISSYQSAERFTDPLQKVFSFIQGVWILHGSGESSFLGFKGLAEGRKAQAFRIPRPKPPMAGESYERVSDRFLAAFRGHQTEECQALLVGAWRAGYSGEQIKHLILCACTDRFATSGHPLIVAMRIFRLLDRTDWRHADLHLACMAGPLIGNMKEVYDYPPIPTDDQSNTARWLANKTEFVHIDPQPVIETLLYGSSEQTVKMIASLLDQGISAWQICHYLTLGMAQRTLKIPSPDIRDPNEPVGWAFCMGQPQHVLTGIDSLRDALRVNPSPAALRGVFQEALFLNSIKHREQYTPHPDFAPVPLNDPEANGSAEELLERLREAINQESGGLAAALTENYFKAGHHSKRVLGLFLDVQRHGLSPFTVPEHYSHGIKFIQAVVDEYELLPPQLDRSLLLIAAAKIIAGFTRKDHTLINHLRAVIQSDLAAANTIA